MHPRKTYRSLLLLFFAALLSPSKGFIASVSRLSSTVGRGGKHDSSILRSSDTIDNPEPVTKQQVESWKKTILEQAAGTSNGVKASPEQRKVIEEAVNVLVAVNPTKDITTSDVATGTWNLVYATTSGISSGKLGPFVGKVQQDLDLSKGVCFNNLRLGPLTGKLKLNWEVMNDQQWKVIFQTIAFYLWGQQVVKKDFDLTGCWDLLYLDQDMRILRGRAMDKETGSLDILTRA